MKAKILVVDDMPDALTMMSDWLRHNGFEVLEATDGPQALQLAKSTRPDLVLMDVVMPGMDGIETCRRLRADPSTSKIPVILITARSPIEARAEGLLAGATDYVTKPVDFKALIPHIKRALSTTERNVDAQRLLDETAHATLTLMPCDLVWLLTADYSSKTLSSRAIASSGGKKAAADFLATVGSTGSHIPIEAGRSPLTEVLISNRPILNLPTDKLKNITGSEALHTALSRHGLGFISIVPLSTGGQPVGVLIMATKGPQQVLTPRGRQVLAALSSQAATVVEHTMLLSDLAEREKQMRREQAYRQTLVDVMGDGLVVVDAGAIVKFVNTRLLRMTGYTRDELIGKSVGEIFHPADREQLVAALTRKSRSTLSFEQRLVTKDGAVLHVLLSRSAVPSTDSTGYDTVLVLSDMSEQKEREEAIAKRTRQLAALNKAAKAISSSLSLDEVIHVILDSATEVAQAAGASLLLRDEETDELIFMDSVGPGAEVMRGLRFPMGQGVAGWVAREARPQLVQDVTRDPRFYSDVDRKTGTTTSSLIAVPMMVQNNVIGVLEVVNKREGTFDEEDVEILASLAGTAAIAIENARLFEQTRRRLTELSTLLDASAAASSTLDIGSVLELIARRLLDALNAGRCTISSWDRETDFLSSLAEVADVYWELGTGPKVTLPSYSLTRASLTSGLPLITHLSDPYADIEDRQALEAMGMAYKMSVPLVVNGNAVGLITLYDSESGTGFSDDDSHRVAQVINAWQTSLGDEASETWFEEENLRLLCHRVMSVTNARWCNVQAWDPDAGQLVLLLEVGFALWDEAQGVGYELKDFPAMKNALSGGIPLSVQPDETNDQAGRELASLAEGGACLMVPLIAHGESIGLVTLIDPRPDRQFDQAEISLCQGIANVVGNALENARLYRSLELRAAALEEAYQELREADRLKDELIQNVSHELRTPLTFITGYLDLLASGDFGPLSDQQKEVMQMVTDKATHLARLVDDIVSMQAMGPDQMNKSIVQLAHIADDALRSAEATAAELGLKLIRDYDDNLPLVLADPLRMGEVFDNLLGNAIKFSPDGGEIRVAIRDDGGPMLTVSVSDQGIGIPKDQQEKIFQRFYQVDGSTTRRFGGTGLGLAIVKGIVESHGGKVWVESEPGKGSIFYFTVPKADPRP